MVLVLHPDVFPYVRLHLAHVIAVRTLEPRLLTALVTQVAGQVPLPSEDATTVRVRAGVRAGFHEPIGASVTLSRRGPLVPSPFTLQR